MKKTLLALACSASIAAVTYGQTLLSWDMTGHGSPVEPTLAAGFVDPLLASTTGLNTLSRTTTLGSAAANSFSSNTWNITGTRVDATNYIGFTIQSAGQQISFTSLQYAMNGSNTAPGTGVWGYSIAGAPFVLQPSFALLNAAPTSLATWDLNGGFTTDQSVEFRFWAFGTASINGGTAAATGTVRIANIAGNDLVLNGSVVPEPATIGLIGVGVLGMAAFARRRKA